MTLSEEAAERLADIVELQPTKNKALQERWGMESGSEVHQYLESELKEYYYRDENSLIRATAEARATVTGEEPDSFEVHMTDFERLVFGVAPGPAEESASVVSVLHRLREAHGDDLANDDGEEPSAKDVRRALQSLKRKGVVELIYRTVPTFRLAVERDAVEVSGD
ncbi:DUF5797 family protein [Halarchaeum nitratireducens]|uniref:Uncharacterized protein n=1 Tax=Halarchaeum nitratireducens TaxID=489913 RepID=A0A830GCM0_9EURY|nr:MULTISPECIES: DUF5797 family protein [Halarchaeum]MBP2252308.1 hypothetical protein [Halarchaeum solikamskense]GGN17448.1 hypothetical protein GCM10009021_17840 [Halarchaeum nitratireducens]